MNPDGCNELKWKFLTKATCIIKLVGRAFLWRFKYLSKIS
jgi:hypothetical protein